MGGSSVELSDVDKLLDCENPLIGAAFLALYFVLEFEYFCYHGNSGWSNVNSNDTVKLPNLDGDGPP